MAKFFMDAHMHFDLYKERDEILNYIETHHSYTIAVTNLPELYEHYYHKYTNYKYIRIALGFHPELVFQYQSQLPIFLNHIETARYIGEVGLDFTNITKENMGVQLDVFREIIKACQNYSDKILSVHSRHAETECIELLRHYNGKIIMHWYSGSIRILREALDMGCYFSINHQMLLSKNGREIINKLPLDRILIESDAPFSKGLKDSYSLFFAEKVYNYLFETREIPSSDIFQIIKDNFCIVIS